MTVSYQSKVTRAKQFGCFIKLLGRWRGSIYKLIWTDLLVFLGLFFTLSMSYHFAMTDGQQKIFEKIAIYCEKYSSLIPISFVLGFYVSLVIGRWWQQYLSIPWPDTLAVWVNSNIRGNDEKDRILRRTLLRYACLSITQCFTLISPRVKKRFPTLEHLVEGGLLLEAEKEIIEEIRMTSGSGANYNTHFIPLVWAAGIVTRARAENKIKNDGVVNVLITEINKIKDSLNLLLSYDWISVPLVYTQVVTLAVYMYFLACLMGKQWLKDPNDTAADGVSEFEKLGIEALVVFFPVFTVLQFFFYMGWLKVAESLLNPFGDDDDDFELNWIVDRHIQVSYLIVDEMCTKYPELLRDQYWEQVVPPELPHTVASEPYKDAPPGNSTSKVNVSEGDAVILPSPSVQANLNTLGSKLNLQEGVTGGGGPGTPNTARRASDLRQTYGSVRPGSLDAESPDHDTDVTSKPLSKLERIGSAVKRVFSAKTVDNSGDGEEFGTLIDIPTVHQETIPELVEPDPESEESEEKQKGRPSKIDTSSTEGVTGSPTMVANTADVI